MFSEVRISLHEHVSGQKGGRRGMFKSFAMLLSAVCISGQLNPAYRSVCSNKAIANVVSSFKSRVNSFCIYYVTDISYETVANVLNRCI